METKDDDKKDFLKIITLAILLIIFVVAILSLVSAYQCNLNEACPLGDFLLNDTATIHTPINLSGCNATLYYSNGSVFGNATAANSSIGWQGYAPTLTVDDQYDFVLCCRFGGEKECLYKEVFTSDYCHPNERCNIRTFIFNSTNGNPITSLGCNLSLYYQNNTPLFENQPMDNQSSGKQNYSTILPAGHLKGLICCSFGGEYLCITKAILVKARQSCPECTTDTQGTILEPPQKIITKRSLSGFLWFMIWDEYWETQIEFTADVRICNSEKFECIRNGNTILIRYNIQEKLFWGLEDNGLVEVELANGNKEEIYVNFGSVNLFLILTVIIVIILTILFIFWFIRRDPGEKLRLWRPHND